jgi:prepilin-type N-terminal cleavage/methylation domain-containing protein
MTRPVVRGFTLIELIGVLAVLAILAVMLVPALIRQMDRLAGEQEATTLKTIGDALRQSILRNRYIPATSDWVDTVVAETGLRRSQINSNPRRNPRFFLIDPDLRIGINAGSTLPYTQTVSGSTNPASPRVIILSSIGQALPNMVSGVPSASDFASIWNWDDTSSTPPGGSLMNGFTRGEDLKVERINLSSLFMKLVLTAFASDGNPRYAIGPTNTTGTIVNGGAGISAYFIRSSILSLFTHDPLLDSQQILDRDASYFYNQNVWGDPASRGAGVGGLDVSTAVDKFLKSPPNLNANVPYGTNQSRVIVTNMITFMSAYRTWAMAGFPNGALKTAAGDAQSTLVTSGRQIFEPGGGANDYRPVENSTTPPCTP